MPFTVLLMLYTLNVPLFGGFIPILNLSRRKSQSSENQHKQYFCSNLFPSFICACNLKLTILDGYLVFVNLVKLENDFFVGRITFA